ncbi:hypothetical protein [Cystobacter ferrugineus]|uniref:Uncharacterized protein n=1 Tax=Cystobacter ferrugineus TaxID=83449 RepID=A0A1L9AXN8_9BACT|nr:hypothetical protein [Cystobacter ferrugineus]OJH34759.1 hypothetical protein BON30_42140 [Cystobacter ferrugineus]
MRPPRYFVPHATSPAEPLALDLSALVHAVDAFRLAGPSGEREWLVCTDITGDLVCVPAEERELLPASTRAQFTHHELVSGRTPRRILAPALFLLSVELVEHPADAQGVNDPVYLYGRLSGPHPGTTSQRVPGQLTVTRGDLLAGLVHGAADALHYAHDPESRLPPRAWHALLPGDRPEHLAQGEGLVLAYPAVPLDMQTRHAGNGPLVATLLHEVLEALQHSARAHGGPRALAELELPVPSRMLAIAELESRGYEVKGDVAILRRNHPGLVNRIAEWLNPEKLTVPREAGTPEFLDLARRALDVLPGWPSETERALRSRERAGPATVPSPTPLAPSAPRPPPAPLPPRAPPAPARPSDWMQDFLDAHARPGGTQARITRSRAAVAPPRPAPPPQRPSPDTSAEWMKDFAPEPAKPSKKAKPATSAPEQASKPEWMSDFED